MTILEMYFGYMMYWLIVTPIVTEWVYHDFWNALAQE